MAKRGESRPWKVCFQYEGDREWRRAYRTEYEAKAAAAEIESYADRAGKRVAVRVEFLAAA